MCYNRYGDIMASSIIHVAVANELNKKLNVDRNQLLIGSIAPDISKQIGETKNMSHFLDYGNSIPNLERFLLKYEDRLNDPFVLGYYIHLITDYFWFKYFIPEVYDENFVMTKLDGTTVKCTGQMFQLYIYNDYTNMNAKLIEKYDLNIDFLYDCIPDIADIIEEIPIERIHVIIDKIREIVETSKVRKDFIFDMANIEKFIQTSVDLISADLERLGIIS